MGKSIPYVNSQDQALLKNHETVICAYARSIGKSTADFTGSDLRGYISFLWKTSHERAHLHGKAKKAHAHVSTSRRKKRHGS